MEIIINIVNNQLEEWNKVLSNSDEYTKRGDQVYEQLKMIFAHYFLEIRPTFSSYTQFLDFFTKEGVENTTRLFYKLNNF